LRVVNRCLSIRMASQRAPSSCVTFRRKLVRCQRLPSPPMTLAFNSRSYRLSNSVGMKGPQWASALGNVSTTPSNANEWLHRKRTLAPSSVCRMCPPLVEVSSTKGGARAVSAKADLDCSHGQWPQGRVEGQPESRPSILVTGQRSPSPRTGSANGNSANPRPAATPA
jgi:hypothetical protein